MSDSVENLEQAQELSIDDLFAQSVDADKQTAAEKELLLKAGTWTTVPPFAPKVTKDKTGRTIINFFGRVRLLDKDGNETDKGSIGFRMSPDRRNAKDFETQEETDKMDRPSKNYVMAVKAFKVAYERDPENVGEVVTYLRDYEIRLRIMQTQSLENMVVAISAVPPQK